MSNGFIIESSNAPIRADLLGGKGASLARLERTGARVPPWFAVTSTAWWEALSGLNRQITSELSRVDYRDPRSIRAASDRIRSLIVEQTMPVELRREIELTLHRYSGSHFAVRSSATVEDSRRDSFAGQLDSHLFVPGHKVVEEVQACWASLFTERCLAYANRREVDLSRAAVAVVVQEMVDARASGVLFTSDPTGVTDDLVVSAGLGLGEGVVADRVQTDSYRLSRAGLWASEIGAKTTRVVFDRNEGEGTRLEAVEAATVDTPILGYALLERLAATARAIRAEFAQPQDIEWAIDGAGDLYITQSRAITTVSVGETAIFDNSNIVESYPGTTLPLTFSHIRDAYSRVFAGALRRLGTDEATLRENEATFRGLLGHVQGQVYYNLTNWYRMFSLLPGVSWFLPIWEGMLGIEDGPRNTRHSRLSEVFRFVRGMARFLTYFVVVGACLRHLRRRFETERERFEALELTQLDAFELMGEYERQIQKLIPVWDLTLLNDGYAFACTGLCQGAMKALGRTEEEFLDWSRQGGAVESVGPVDELNRMSDLLRRHSGLRMKLAGALEHEPDRATSFLSECQELEDAFGEYLQRWGDRSLEELKLESRSFVEEPERLLKLIVRGAEAHVVPAGRTRSLPPTWIRWILSPLMAAARRSVRLRESSRLDRARAFGMMRRLFWHLGEVLAREGHLDRREDIYFLTVDELRGFVSGTGANASLRSLVEARSAEFDGFRGTSLPPRFRTRGAVGASRIVPVHVQTEYEGLNGYGCSPGRVEGEVLVVRDPKNAGESTGRILVAPSTDPGWVFLMLSAAGLVVEKGSLLSHSAIVGRELGIPTVVGVKDATQALQTGQKIRLDGGTGTIELMKEFA